VSERNKWGIGIPTDIESYLVKPKELANAVGETALKATNIGKDFADSVIEKGVDSAKSNIDRSKDLGATALTGLKELATSMTHEVRSKISGLPGLGDRHPEDK
jgi:hypothetical protein